MNTSPIREKINRFNAAPKLDFAIELVRELSDWLNTMERVNSDEGWEYHSIVFDKLRQDELIELLVDMLVITGNADKLAFIRLLDRDKIKKAVDFLVKNKDKNNHRNIYTIATLLDMAEAEGVKVETIVELVKYANRSN